MPSSKPPFNIHIHPMGNVGNRMLQYMAALKVSSVIPGSVISNVALDEWNISRPPLEQGEVLTERFFDERAMRIDLAGLLDKVATEGIQRYELGTYAQHMDNFLEVSVYREVFKAPESYEGFDERYLVCNIRGGDALTSENPHYPVLPPDFYRDLARDTGLELVFMGQLGNDSYTTSLRERFPDATFRPSRGAVGDFETIRNSKNIVLSVSTFSWLAAWLSNAKQIFLPVAGFYNIAHFKQIDLIPLNDRRYRFYLFPHYVAADLDQLPISHAALAGLWREVDRAMVESYRREFPRFAVAKADLMDAFDEGYYLKQYEDVRIAVQDEKVLRSGLDHYDEHGFEEGRRPFRLDPIWYQSQYPTAALEVGQGDFAGFHEHYVRIGRKRGYIPHP